MGAGDFTSWFIVALALIMILVFALVLYWAYQRTRPPGDIIIPTPGGTGSFLSPCRVTTCPAGLDCDPVTLVCKQGAGSLCRNYSDCLTGYYCSGVCVTGPFGQLSQNCPCTAGLTCAADPSRIGALVCKVPTGATCNVNGDCAADRCVQGLCVAPGPTGATCSSDVSCQSGFCDRYGICQNPGITSGQLGAACLRFQPTPPAGLGCGPGLQCFTTGNTPSGAGATAGVCVGATSGYGQICTAQSLCVDPLLCININNGAQCAFGPTSICECNLSINPNNCTTAQACAENFVCNGATCLAGPGQACFAAAPYQICQHSCDSSQGAILVLNRAPGTAIGATSLSWSLHSKPPFKPQKLFSVIGTDGSEFLYAVDQQSGFYIYTASAGWRQLLSNIIMQPNGSLRLIDMASDGNIFVGVFVLTQNSPFFIGVVVYIVDPFEVVFTPYPVNNPPPTGYPPGTQFDNTSTVIAPLTISISRPNNLSPGGDLVVLDQKGRILVRPKGDNLFSLSTKTLGTTDTGQPVTGTNPQFYYDGSEQANGQTISWPSAKNFSYIGPTSVPGSNIGTVAQFNGNVFGIFLPSASPIVFNINLYKTVDYSIYSPLPQQTSNSGMKFSSMLAVAENSLTQVYGVYLNEKGVQVIIPGWFSADSKVAVTSTQYLVYTTGLCT
jgi:uncharacterized protein YjeT (DUF2065 family)